MNKYFVFFHFNGKEYGSIGVEIDYKLNKMDNIRRLEKDLEGREGRFNLIINNWKKIK